MTFLAACATEQSVVLLPRGPGGQGKGTLDRINQMLVVELNGKQYRGRPIMQTATRTNVFGAVSGTTYTNQFNALLIGDGGGQIRCDYGFDQMSIQANGVCVDFQNVTYDLLITNP